MINCHYQAITRFERQSASVSATDLCCQEIRRRAENTRQ